MTPTHHHIAVIIPCFNEAATIGMVIRELKEVRPDAAIYVYDNNSTDKTRQIATAEKALVRLEPRQGKGNVVRRMFADVEANIYVLIDGDATYDVQSLNKLIDTLLNNNLDMVVGRRIETGSSVYRYGHRFGNRLLTGISRILFGEQPSDLLSGYRVMSRRFIKSFPAVSSGFEIETELTLHALSLNIPTAEVETTYRSRPPESVSKLNTYRDGARILSTILLFTKEERPFFFFSLLSLLLGLISLSLGIPVTLEFFETGLVPKLPTAVLSASIMLLAFLGLTSGMILDSVARGRREQKRLAYLRLDWLGQANSAPTQVDT